MGISKNLKKVSVTPAKAGVQEQQTAVSCGPWMPDQVRHDDSCWVFRTARMFLQRLSNVMLLSWLLLGLGLLWTGFDAQRQQAAHLPAIAQTAAWGESLGLTDLALFTEARFTRHLSQADNFAAWQNHPLGLEHFPSGSIITPPGRK